MGGWVPAPQGSVHTSCLFPAAHGQPRPSGLDRVDGQQRVKDHKHHRTAVGRCPAAGRRRPGSLGSTEGCSLRSAAGSPPCGARASGGQRVKAGNKRPKGSQGFGLFSEFFGTKLLHERIFSFKIFIFCNLDALSKNVEIVYTQASDRKRACTPSSHSSVSRGGLDVSPLTCSLYVGVRVRVHTCI